MSTSVRVSNVNTCDELDAALSSLAGERCFVLFSGAVDTATGSSWCPDCVEAEPVVMAELEKVAAEHARVVNVIKVPLVRAEYRGNAEHWARKHPKFRLQRIPTLYCVSADGKAPLSLVEDQCKDAELVAELVTA